MKTLTIVLLLALNVFGQNSVPPSPNNGPANTKTAITPTPVNRPYAGNPLIKRRNNKFYARIAEKKEIVLPDPEFVFKADQFPNYKNDYKQRLDLSKSLARQYIEDFETEYLKTSGHVVSRPFLAAQVVDAFEILERTPPELLDVTPFTAPNYRPKLHAVLSNYIISFERSKSPELFNKLNEQASLLKAQDETIKKLTLKIANLEVNSTSEGNKQSYLELIKSKKVIVSMVMSLIISMLVFVGFSFLKN